METTMQELMTNLQGAMKAGITEGMAEVTAKIDALRTSGGEDNPDALAALNTEITAKFEALRTDYNQLKAETVQRLMQPITDQGLGKHVRIPMTEKALRRAPRDEAELTGQRMNDELYTLKTLLGLDAKSLRETETFKDYVDFYGKAVDSLATGTGLEWTPVGYSAQVVDATFITNMVAGLFPTINMPTASYKVPIQLARPKAYKTSRATDITEFTDSFTDDMTFDAVSMGVFVKVSKEATEDLLLPILPWLQTEMALGLGEGRERCILNGDTTGTHMDTDIETAGAAAAETCWDGLRHRALGLSAAKVDLATFNADQLLAMRALMGKYGLFPAKLAWIMNTGIINKCLLLKDSAGNPLVQTIDKYGANATVVTGEIGRLFGSPIVPSEWCREDTTATGINGVSGNTKKTCLLVNREAFYNGDRRSVTLETQPDIVPQTIKVVATQRVDFKHVFVDTAVDVVLGYNN